MKSYTLGLDLGSTSVGWALVANDPEPGQNNLIAGVRVFPEGVDRPKGSLEESKMAKRRQARLMRRQHERRSRRKRDLQRLLRRTGLLPETDEAISDLLRLSPWQLRQRGLDEPLNPHELGRVLLHLNQRRGFRSNRKERKGDRAKDANNKKVEPAIAGLRAAMVENGARTLGEHLAGLEGEEHLRNRPPHFDRYTAREMFENEFDLLWTRHAQAHPELLTDDMRERIQRVIFFQRPLKPGRRGKCELEPQEDRAPRAAWIAQETRLLQDVNHLRIHHGHRQPRDLTEDERQRVLAEIRTKGKATVAQLRKILSISEDEELSLERQKRKSIPGNAADQALCAVLGEESTPQRRSDLWDALLIMGDEEFDRHAAEKWGLSREQIDTLFDGHDDSPDGFAMHSAKALWNLLPPLQGGVTYDKAKAAAYPPREAVVLDELPPAPMGINNPIVRQALVEVRRVVNAIFAEYGKPTKIVIELAREAKGTSEQRNKQLKENRQREQERKEIERELRDLKCEPSPHQILKFRLWKELAMANGGAALCPYTGKVISTAALFSDHPQFEVEHILPFSRSLDNSFMNKTLCCVDENRRKLNQTPIEAYGSSPEQFGAILARVKGLPQPKRRRFEQREIDTDKCIDRQLNDTRYISRAACEYLQQIMPPHAVTVARGDATAHLRRLWGLNKILSSDGSNEKSRDDHRHHAVDAVVVALTGPRHLQLLAHHWDFRRIGEKMPPPWGDFWMDVKQTIEGIVVSHRVRRHVRGELHEETNYGPVYDGNNHRYRKPLSALEAASVKEIADDRIRELVEQRIDQHGGDLKSALSEKSLAENPLCLPNRNGPPVPIRRVRLCKNLSNAIPITREGEDRPYRWVKSKGNHHMAIFEDPATGRRHGVVVSRFEAAQRARENHQRAKQGLPPLSIVRREHPEHPEWRFVFSLAINEIVELAEDDPRGRLWRVQKMDVNQSITLRPNLFAGDLKDKGTELRKRVNQLRAQKLHVDVLGRVFPAND